MQEDARNYAMRQVNGVLDDARDGAEGYINTLNAGRYYDRDYYRGGYDDDRDYDMYGGKNIEYNNLRQQILNITL
jgi:hypothetical protein